MNRSNSEKADLLGIVASMTCAVHCSVLPLAITYGILSSGIMESHGIIEVLFCGLSLLIASYTLWGSYKGRHGNPIPLISFVFGLGCIIIGLGFHGNLEIVFATLGGLTIASAHLHNILINRAEYKT